MEEKGLSQLFEPSFCIAAIENDSEYDVILSHDDKALSYIRKGQKLEIVKLVPFRRCDIPSTNQIMYKIEDLPIKPAGKKSFFVSLYFSTIFSEEFPCITSITNLYGLKRVKDSIFQTKTLDENILLHNTLPHEEDMYAVTAIVYLAGKHLRESRCEIAHMFQPKKIQ